MNVVLSSDWPWFHVVYTNDRPRFKIKFDIRLNPDIVKDLESNDGDVRKRAHEHICKHVRSHLSSKNRRVWRKGSILWRNLTLTKVVTSK